MEACLGRVADRGPLLLTLGAAGATVLVMLVVVGIPALDACRGDARGVVGCLRGNVNERFDLGDRLPPASPPVVTAPETPAIAETPAVAEAPAVAETPTVAVTAPQPPLAEAPLVQSGPQPNRSLAPPVTDKPAAPAVAPPQQAVVEPPVETSPEAPPAAVETIDAEQPEVTPTPETTPLVEAAEPDAPSFVPPPPSIVVEGIPPDLQVAAALPEAAPPSEAAPDFVLPTAPELPTTPPPDLVAPAEPATAELPVPEPAVVEPPVAEASDAPELPVTEAPEPLVAAQPVAEPAPDFALPTTPDLPTTPPPDLTVAAIDPVVPDDPPPAAPVLAPSIDAVEIDGDGNVIAGNGPAGATMRLYVDGIPAGVSPVEAGRWLVEGTGLLTEPRQTLKVEALDAVTGKLVGEATVEFEQPAQPAAEAPVTVDGPVAVPFAVPEISPVLPVGEGPSVTILRPSGSPQITTLTTGEPSAGAVVTLGAPPKLPAPLKQLPITETAPDIIVFRAEPLGESSVSRIECGEGRPLVYDD